MECWIESETVQDEQSYDKILSNAIYVERMLESSRLRDEKTAAKRVLATVSDVSTAIDATTGPITPSLAAVISNNNNFSTIINISRPL